MNEKKSKGRFAKIGQEMGVPVPVNQQLPRQDMQRNALPETGLVRLSQILGNPKADPPIPAIIPVGKSSWWEGVKSGRYPKPIKLGPRTTCWKVDDIRALCGQMHRST